MNDLKIGDGILYAIPPKSGIEKGVKDYIQSHKAGLSNFLHTVAGAENPELRPINNTVPKLKGRSPAAAADWRRRNDARLKQNKSNAAHNKRVKAKAGFSGEENARLWNSPGGKKVRAAVRTKGVKAGKKVFTPQGRKLVGSVALGTGGAIAGLHSRHKAAKEAKIIGRPWKAIGKPKGKAGTVLAGGAALTALGAGGAYAADKALESRRNARQY